MTEAKQYHVRITGPFVASHRKRAGVTVAVDGGYTGPLTKEQKEAIEADPSLELLDSVSDGNGGEEAEKILAEAQVTATEVVERAEADATKTLEEATKVVSDANEEAKAVSEKAEESAKARVAAAEKQAQAIVEAAKKEASDIVEKAKADSKQSK